MNISLPRGAVLGNARRNTRLPSGNDKLLHTDNLGQGPAIILQTKIVYLSNSTSQL